MFRISSCIKVSVELTLLSLVLHGGVQSAPAASQNAIANVATATRPAGLEYPVADPKAVVVGGHARFTVLASQMIRKEWAI